MNVEVGGVSREADYHDWLVGLEELLLHPQREGREEVEITLFVDDELFDGQPDGFSAEGLGRAVREALGPPGNQMFAPIARDCQRWRRQGDPSRPPPSLPVLVASVLAASRMDADQRGAQHNYYLRLAELLAPSSDAEEVESWRSALADNYSDVKPRWEELKDWLNRQGFVSSITGLPHLPYAGYPISQAVLRRRDRRILTQFWEIIDLDPSQVTRDSRGSLLVDLRRWVVNSSRGFSAIFRAFVLEPGTSGWMEDVLARLATSWDGQVLDEAGYRVENLQLIAIALPGAHSYDFYWSDQAGDTLLPLEDRHLHEGLEHRESDRVLRSQGVPVVVMHYNDLDSSWQAGPIETWTPLMLVYRDDLGDAVREFAANLVGESKLGTLHRGRVGSARWVQIGAIGDEERLRRATKVLGDAVDQPMLAALSGGERPRARLVGGLRVDTALGKHVYLVGGEPDLAYPNVEFGEAVDVVLDGRRQTLKRHVIPLPCRDLTWLAAGRHQGEAGGSGFVFETVVDPTSVGGRPSRLRVGLASGAWQATVDPPPTAMLGALIPRGVEQLHAAQELTVWVPRGSRAVHLIGPGGQCRRLEEPSKGELWKEAFPEFDPLTFQVARSWTEGWLAIEHRNGSKELRELRAVPTSAEPLGGEIDRLAWRRLVEEYADVGNTRGWLDLVDSAG